MAEIVVNCLIRKLGDLLLQDLHDLLKEEVKFLRRVKKEVKLLQDKLQWIQGLLKDVNGTRSRNERAAIWVAQIRDVGYEAEDVIDTFIFEVEQQRRRQRSSGVGVMGPIARLTGRTREIPTIHGVGKKIIDIRERLEGIAASRRDFGIDDLPVGGEARKNHLNQGQLRRARIADGADVVGMEEDARRLMGRLVNRKLRRRAVVSITGMGGIGKTTLAKKVYHSDDVKLAFDVPLWVTVAREYQVKELLFTLINSITVLSQDEMKTMDEEKLQQRLSEFLKNERYLVVVDDIWDREAWNGLADAFPDTHNGSRVLLTTRNEDVASYADARSPPHKMHTLDENKSWELFCNRAFPESAEAAAFPSQLLIWGKKIVTKCCGLPLAIDVLGSLLSRRPEEPSEWQKVLNGIEWWLNDSPDQISGILALSYYDLPYYLKPCFLYFGAFHEDSEISANRVIQLWIAEGFVERRGGGQELEDVAEDYLEELASRSMIQVTRRKTNRAVHTCRIHDLLHDLAISIAKREMFLAVNNGNSELASSTTARRFAINHHSIASPCISLSTPHFIHLRSLLCFAQDHGMLEVDRFKIVCRGFKLLRVMDLQFVQLSSLPDDIGSLIHLRYLSLKGAGDKLTSLPGTITRLYNLQTLDLRQTHIESLPGDLSKMKQLRHLLVRHEYHSRYGAYEITENMQIDLLSNLQTLLVVRAGSWIGRELGRLSNLRDFHMEGDLMSHECALTQCIAQLLRLRSLHLDVAYKGVYIDDRRLDRRLRIPALTSFSGHQGLYKMVLVGRLKQLLDLNHFPPYLSELYLRQSQLQENPMSTLKNLPSLRILTLDEDSYVGTEMSCSGGFPRLEKLRMVGLYGLEEWRLKKDAMKSLTHLEISKCSRLRMLPDGLQHITTLQELTLVRMPGEFKARLRKNTGKDWFKIQHIPSLFITDVLLPSTSMP